MLEIFIQSLEKFKNFKNKNELITKNRETL